MRIVVIGGSGFIGSHLCKHLGLAGHQVAVVRRPYTVERLLAACTTNATQNLNTSSDEDQGYAIVNLAGASVNRGRWSAHDRKEILTSRVATTKAVVTAICQAPQPPHAYVQASAIGYYGTSFDATFTEDDAPGDDFLATVCTLWEQAAQPVYQRTRVVYIRLGMVLGKDGGALPSLLPLFRIGLGGTVGNGRQWVSWIHVADASALIEWSLRDDRITGPLNATAPHPVQMRDFTGAIARQLHRPHLLSAPAPILRLALGQRAQLVLTGQRVLPAKAAALHFQFAFPHLDAALADIL
ncbi:epimerase [Alicyclobacillus hesperidum subsp. aegles]|uniref:TIGR01777 family oxidoreductase n=1 Tax=Alicyclobacillus hesperidum TaxID=89784 RepID=UPI00222AD180|nr:TIGR01777 family oxidoreductase [Alicyclobacillus hesperidum]GLG00495.1 epimerase [Alicyclobacillus hesperidum subsp. aegles]